MKTFAIGDLHGNFRGLKQVLERSGFDYENDRLITLGDICDGYSEVYECVEELLKIKDRIDIKGNHDEPFTTFINLGLHDWSWKQGGDATLKSYGKHALGEGLKIDRKLSGGWLTNLNAGDIPETHKDFFNHQIFYHVDDDNRCFVHGGFNRHDSIKNQNPIVYTWDRDLWLAALSFKTVNPNQHITGEPYKFKMKDNFSEVFIGHTSTINWRMNTEPMKAANIWNLDTGAGYYGKVTIMDVNTHDYWQSDLARDLYPNETGR